MTINTGDLIGSKWQGPRWTPYAQAIARNYKNLIPWYQTMQVDLGAPPSFTTQFTEDQEHDVLIMGAHALATAADFPFYFLQITHDQTGIPWCAPNIVPFAPLTAFAGVNLAGPTKFPDAFFYPRGTRLRLDWSNIDPAAGNLSAATLTLIGVQLVDPIGGQAPQQVLMPDDQTINVGSRVPLFMTIGMGSRGAASQIFTFTSNSQAVQYLPPIECDVEIHDASLNFFSTYGSANIVTLKIKLVVAGVESGWTPSFAPVMSIYGRDGAVYPQLPFCKPYLLPKDHRYQMNMINPNNAAPVSNGLITLRGVRLCEY